MRRLPAVLVLLALLSGLAASAAELQITVLDRAGQALAEAVVMVDSSMPGQRPVPPAEITIAQEKLRFHPAVSIVAPGTRIVFSNKDSFDHHVIAGLMGPGGVYLDPNQNIQLRLSGKSGGRVPGNEVRSFNQTGPYLLGCHLHSSMRGHLYVADSPWAQLSGADGKLLVAGVPEGPVKVRIWHADQLLDVEPTSAQLVAGVNRLTIKTQVQQRKSAAPTSAYPY
ncbi:plastocyanin [Pelomonas sp. SE-A7]|uniref:cupredoxin domain-containing protein n=1 Tax=Pelomonas sp. SE-A7 TaxID=3054953 RepID=UPI00259CAAF4|nr:plastocyanin [Pelomonas sp. SE-A7]MDM4764673.1 plastocyanin [Pelomonas sp. SE-A7]